MQWCSADCPTDNGQRKPAERPGCLIAADAAARAGQRRSLQPGPQPPARPAVPRRHPTQQSAASRRRSLTPPGAVVSVRRGTGVLQHPGVHGNRRRGRHIDGAGRPVLPDPQQPGAAGAQLLADALALRAKDEQAALRQLRMLKLKRARSVVDRDRLVASLRSPDGSGWWRTSRYRLVTMAPRLFHRRRPTTCTAPTLKAFAVRTIEPILRSCVTFSIATCSPCAREARSARTASTLQ